MPNVLAAKETWFKNHIKWSDEDDDLLESGDETDYPGRRGEPNCDEFISRHLVFPNKDITDDQLRQEFRKIRERTGGRRKKNTFVHTTYGDLLSAERCPLRLGKDNDFIILLPVDVSVVNMDGLIEKSEAVVLVSIEKNVIVHLIGQMALTDLSDFMEKFSS